ncbi:MAG: DUF4838 domain-containing protein [Bacteroidetes bacterium]|nr:DUF4838 domain-containing protein [Bacteroidota bacterium]
MRFTAKKLFFLLTVFLSSYVHAQMLIVKNGLPASRIIIVNDHPEEKTAALLLQSFIEKISGAKLPVVNKISVNKNGDILINNSDDNKSGLLKEGGFYLSCSNNMVGISSTAGKGVIYGVVTLLEKYLGVDYFSEFEYSFPKEKNIILPEIDMVDNPAFRYRQTQNYAIKTDSLYSLWFRLSEPNEEFAAGYWVHTFDRLLPSAVYGKSHPEYYAYFNGERHPGKASQWCLSNDTVFNIVSNKVDSIFKSYPGKPIISVSQNDGNYTNCTCERCKAIDDHEGAFSGSLITFINKLANRFPGKQISTLAYLYTMNPPKYVKPLPNVNIMLCDIDCNREVSLTENESGRNFMKALKGWSSISKNIFVWDYGINFDNYLSPFPNFHIMQDNIRLFKKYHATMHFSQVSGTRGGDFSELRTYLVAKLMWNPEVDMDSLMKHFLNGYYGVAGPYLYQYIKVMEGALLGSGLRLWIYDSPVSHKKGMLKPELMLRYNQLFDEAEKAVADDPVLLKRVQRSRLSLQYSELEIARTKTEKDYNDINNKLNLFEERVKEFNVTALNERNNSPVEYCKLYKERYIPHNEQSIAKGASVNYLVPPAKKYLQLADTALTDGLFGGSSFVDSWVGWEGSDASMIIDLGKTKTIHRVEADFLQQLGAWILFPVKVDYSYSEDGRNYTHCEMHDIPEDRSPEVKFAGIKSTLQQPVNARYIKIEVTATKVCPEWHYGVGHPSWMFMDEVTVQ